ncbi:hypothetical protein M0Q50_03550 [bacterium]|jgi:hypothetical protein|nr:hypothetical protein [bacterium]
MKNLKTFENFKYNDETDLTNEALSNLQKEYREYFQFLLKCFDVTSPTKLSDDKKSKFFDIVKKYWVKGKGTTKSLDKIKEDLIECGCCKE